MKDGEVQQFDTPQTLYDRPCNMFVAGFIGSPQMNFIHTRVQKTGDVYSLEFGDWKTTVPPEKVRDAGFDAYVGQEVCMGVRSEDVHLAAEDTPSKITAHVDLAEMMGNEIYLYITAFGQQMVARVPARAAVHTGDDLSMCIDAENLHLFDLTTQQRIGK